MRNTIIIEAPINLGLPRPAGREEPGVNRLPAWLRQHGFHEKIRPTDIQVLHAPPYQKEIDPKTEVLNADAIVEFAKEQAVMLQEAMDQNAFPLILGGDCSVLIGSVLALKQKGNYALFYLDGHTDFIHPSQSSTHAVAGMTASIAAGIGPDKLTNIYDLQPYIKEENIWCVGNREYDADYERTIEESVASYYPLNKLRKTGIENCAHQFLKKIEEKNLDGFLIHLDLDVLNDELMPAVDSRTPDGLSYAELEKILFSLLSHPKAAAIEITILDPDLDPTAVYTKEFISSFSAVYGKAIAGA